jgi:beta-1,2-mannobiose phosphorylase / 1,2-beta-oligomannan phosphorylase
MHKQLIIDAKQIRPSRPDLEVLGIFNPAVVKFDGQIIMLARVAERAIQDELDWFKIPTFSMTEGWSIVKLPINDPKCDFSDVRVVKYDKKSFLTSISHLRIGRSHDGIHFVFDEKSHLIPDNMYEEYGIEDPRITQIGNKFYITYTAISRHGITVRLMVTDDFQSFSDIGNIFHSDNKDCLIFPEKISGKYFALHRPSYSQFGQPDIWTAESDNLIDWGNHKIMCEARVDYMNSSRVGAGAVPILTDMGWVEVYHSADSINRYHLAAMLLDKSDPNIVLRRSKKPLVEPTEDYEIQGFVNNVVFTCGLLREENDLMVYYGVCDEKIALATISMDEVMENMGVVQ